MAGVVLQVGQVWRGMVPFGEVDDAKHRPVVILGWAGLSSARGDAHVLVVPSTTFGGDPSKARESDIRLRDWTAAGLGQDSFVQCARLWSLAPQAIDTSKYLGKLDEADRQAVWTEVAKMFSVTLATI